VQIEDLLQDVDEWCGFTRAFQALAGYQSRAKDHHRSLLATLIAHGANLGLAAMSCSACAPCSALPSCSAVSTAPPATARSSHCSRGTIDISIIIERWDQLVRLIASLKARTAPAHVVMQRLANAWPTASFEVKELPDALHRLAGRGQRPAYRLYPPP